MSDEKGFDETRWHDNVFAVSIQALKTESGKTIAEHRAISVMGSGCDSYEKARQMAVEAARKLWPESDGWTGHNAECIEVQVSLYGYRSPLKHDIP